MFTHVNQLCSVNTNGQLGQRKQTSAIETMKFVIGPIQDPPLIRSSTDILP